MLGGGSTKYGKYKGVICKTLGTRLEATYQEKN